MPSSDPDPILDGLREHELQREPALPERYELLGELGRGGMAVVFRARDRQLAREVAIKVLREEFLVEPPDRARFRREADAVARLSHPNVVTVFDAGANFLVMELVKGGPLKRATPDLLEKVARGVHAAHEQGIVHRDLKPSNILLTESGEPKVADFGIAHLAGEATRLTKSGSVIGTPQYMAPEQVQGRTGEISPRTDVYALGAILYEGLAGRPPHTAETPIALFQKIVNEEPARLGAGDLETIALKAIEKDPARRYASALEFSEDLQRCREGAPILARPPSAFYRLRKKMAKRKAVLAVGACGLVAVIVLLSIMLAKLAESRRTQRLWSEVSAILNDAELDARAGDVKGARDRLDKGITLCRDQDSAAAKYFMGRLFHARGRRAEAIAVLDRALAMNPKLGEAHFERGIIYVEEYGAALARAQSAFAGRGPMSGAGKPPSGEELEELHPELATIRGKAISDLSVKVGESVYFRPVDAVYGTAELARMMWEWETARAELNRVLALEPRYVRARLALAKLAYFIQEYETAEREATVALAEHKGLGEGYLVRSQALFWRAEGVLTREAIEWRDRALADATKAIELGEDAYSARGNVRLRTDDRDGAIADFAKSLELNPRDAITLNHRGVARSRKDLKGAVEDFTAAVEISPGFAMAWWNRAQARTQLNEIPGAIADAEKALEVAPPEWPYRDQAKDLIRMLKQ